MKSLYSKLYNAINEGLAKSLNILHINDEDNKVTYQHSKANTYLDPLQYEFIDLNLPSGTLWCDHNLGADCNDDPESWYGDYYSWGGIKKEVKSVYKIEYIYKYSNDKGDKLFKYNTKIEKGTVDNLITLLSEDDIVQIEYSKINSKIAEKVMMPTKEQLDELLKYTNNKWITNYKGIKGLNGRIFIGSNRNSIFIPAAGIFNGKKAVSTCDNGYLWSSSLNLDNPLTAQHIFFDSDNIFIRGGSRYFGFSVRGVYSKN